MNVLENLHFLLNHALESSYFKQPLNSEIDQKLKKEISALRLITKKELDLLFKKISCNESRILGLFAERMASIAVRNHDITLVKYGLYALLIYSQTEDPRDVILVLSLLYDAADKISEHAKETFESVISETKEEKLLRNFLKRNDEDKSIESMGYKESKDKDGFLYVRTW